MIAGAHFCAVDSATTPVKLNESRNSTRGGLPDLGIRGHCPDWSQSSPGWGRSMEF